MLASRIVLSISALSLGSFGRALFHRLQQEHHISMHVKELLFRRRPAGGGRFLLVLLVLHAGTAARTTQTIGLRKAPDGRCVRAARAGGSAGRVVVRTGGRAAVPVHRHLEVWRRRRVRRRRHVAVSGGGHIPQAERRRVLPGSRARPPVERTKGRQSGGSCNILLNVKEAEVLFRINSAEFFACP